MRFLGVVLALLPFTNGLYFHMREGEKRCFIEEVPEDTVVLAKYRLELHDPQQNKYVENPNVEIRVNIRGPNDDLIMDKSYKDSPGRFSFTSEVPGEHVICLHTTAGWFGAQLMRVHLDILMGEASNEYDKIQKDDKLDDLQLRVRQLLDQVDQISKEQAYQRVREARFRQTSESTNSRVVTWSVIQLAILLGAGYWQMYHLKSFFQAKKLV